MILQSPAFLPKSDLLCPFCKAGDDRCLHLVGYYVGGPDRLIWTADKRKIKVQEGDRIMTDSTMLWPKVYRNATEVTA